MQTRSQKIKMERINFTVSPDLFKKTGEVANEFRISISELSRRALTDFLMSVEYERLQKELADGYKANYKYYLKSSEEWKYADSI